MSYDVGFINTNTQQIRINNRTDLLKLSDDHAEILSGSKPTFAELHRQIDEFLNSLEPLLITKSTNKELRNPTTEGENQELRVPTSVEIESYFIDTVKAKPIVSCFVRQNKIEYIVGICDKSVESYLPEHHLCILKSFAKRWQIVFDKTLDDSACFAEVRDNQVISHNERLFYYIEREIHWEGTACQGLGCLEFGLFDFEQNEYVSLSYSGKYRDQKIEGEFDFKTFAQTGTPEHLEILEGRAATSNHIYFTPKNYNIDAFENYIEKWVIENRSFFFSQTGTVNFSFYKQDLFNTEFEYEIVENSSYKIGRCFAGPLVGYSKAEDKYFVIIVPEGFGGGGSWGDRSINEISFLTDSKIMAKNGYESYQVDLKSGTYERRPLEHSIDLMKI